MFSFFINWILEHVDKSGSFLTVLSNFPEQGRDHWVICKQIYVTLNKQIYASGSSDQILRL